MDYIDLKTIIFLIFVGGDQQLHIFVQHIFVLHIFFYTFSFCQYSAIVFFSRSLHYNNILALVALDLFHGFVVDSLLLLSFYIAYVLQNLAYFP